MNDVIGVGGGAGGRFGGRYGGKSRVDTRLRKAFLETAYWNPSVVTGPDGMAKITIKLPDNITTWKVMARGLNEKAAGGRGEAVLEVRKRIFALLYAPARLVEGDRATFRARIVNSGGDPLKARVTLTLEGEASGRFVKEIALEPRGEAELEFDVAAKTPGTIKARLIAKAGEFGDTMEQSVEVVPFGVAVRTGKSGNAETTIHETIALPEGRRYTHRSMEIIIGPTDSDFLLHLASEGQDGFLGRPGLEEGGASARLTTRLSALNYLRRSGRSGFLSVAELERRIEEALASLLLGQMRSGAFPGIGKKEESLPATGEALTAMAFASKLGFHVPEKNLIACRDWIKKTRPSLDEGRKIYGLHAISLSEKADFTELNRFYRIRNQLKNVEAAMLALAFFRGGRRDQADTLMEILLNRNVFTSPTDRDEDRKSRFIHSAPWVGDELLTLAYALHALALTRPKHPMVQTGAKTLMETLAARWHTARAVAASAAALSEYLAGASLAAARYTLEISVNGQRVETLAVNGPSKVETIRVPAGAIREGLNRVDLAFEGRGRFTYAVRMTGFTPDVRKMPWNASNPIRLMREYSLAPLRYEGREVPRGFSTVNLRRDEKPWSNDLLELNEGEIAWVILRTDHFEGMDLFHTIAITDRLPAGCSVVESGIKGNHQYYEVGDGTITFYVSRRTADITYPIYGAFKGSFRTPPPVARSLYDYDLFALGDAFDLKLNPRGAAKTVEYRMTPDALYQLGVWNYDDEHFAVAGEFLSRYLRDFSPREKPLLEAAGKLFKIAFIEGDDAGLIQYFELLRERARSLTLSFKETARVASSYRSANEHEQALELFSVIAGASFGRESRVTLALEKQEEYEGALEYMAGLILAYPDLPKVQSALFALSQKHMEKTGAPGTRARIPGKTRKQILLEGLDLLLEFLVTYPENPVADEAAYSLISTLLDLEKGREAARLCALFGERWPKSRYKSSIEYVQAFALFEIGEYQTSRDLLARVADRAVRGLTPLEKDDRDLARYILGQIEHADGRIEAALARYESVKGKFEDAAEAIAYFTHKAVSLPEVSTFRTGKAVSLDLTYRNVPRVKLSVYRVDLMKLYLARKSLNAVTNINLAGIHPLLAEEFVLGDGKDYRDKKKRLDLPMKEQGAYLLVVQGNEAGCSGMVLISDLEMEVQEDAASGRVRVNVKDAGTRAFLKNVYTKVIGSRNEHFQGGYTDLRGIFVTENISGTSAVIAEQDGQYAFYRGRVALQPKPAQTRKKSQQQKQAPALRGKRGRALQNIFQNTQTIQQRGRQMLKGIYQQQEGVEIIPQRD